MQRGFKLREFRSPPGGFYVRIKHLKLLKHLVGEGAVGFFQAGQLVKNFLAVKKDLKK